MMVSQILHTLEAKADSVGYTMTESMNTIWNSANQVITNYGTNFLSSITGVQNAINDLTNLIKQLKSNVFAKKES